MYYRFLILIGRSFIATFLIVNFFNIIPLNFSSNVWLAQVSMLFVDTASFLLLGLVAIKICALIDLKNHKNNSNFLDKERNEISLEKKEKNVIRLNMFSKYFMIFFIILGISQFYSFFNGMNLINVQYLTRYQEIENRFNLAKDKLDSSISENSIDIENKLKSIELKRENYNKELDKKVSKMKFLLVRGNFKVFIMSSIWAYGLYKFSNLNLREGEEYQ